ncbi:cardiolipin synthase [Microaceticoccus formicicus]|uniref:cardiolipin synthase n=1 Tax=Microaceticoccus formicicus TaxID=3118105 RepID=UPI003CD04419|nr:cardiolipin synthase [Peptoniphilaceae bacterium AMB_02]
MPFIEITSRSFWWVNILLALLVVFLGRHKNPKSTLMWVMVLTMIPGLGFILYLFLGQDYKKRQMFLLKEEQDEFINNIALFQTDFISKGKFFYNNEKTREYYDLIRMNLEVDESFYTQDNDIELFYWGKEKFARLLQDIENATQSIDLQYYIFKYDNIGSKLIKALERKAKEGIEVRVLYDGVGGRTLKKRDFEKLEKYGGEVNIFFPSLIRSFNFKLNYRNHRKIVVIDNRIGYVGGFNVGDEYLGLHKKFGPWRDTHIRIEGSGVLGLKVRFIKDWKYASGKLSETSEHLSGRYNPEGNSGIQIITSGPDTQFENIKNAYFKMITSAREEIFIQTPYFVPDEAIMDALKTAIISGVKVTIMIPGNPDHPFVYWASLSYLGTLLHAGARVYLYDTGFLHCKTLVIDDYVSTVGSANMDIRSFALNFEVNAVIYDEAVNESLKNQFMLDIEKSKEMTLEDYLNRGRIVKIKEAFSRLLSPVL